MSIIYQPFTYLIGWTKLNVWYYGCRYAKECQPYSLWKTYFTSSKLVKEMREYNGEPDYIVIDKIFTSANEALTYEEKYLKNVNAMKQSNWLNENIRGSKFSNKGHNEETKRKIKEGNIKAGNEGFRKGRIPWNKGKSGYHTKPASEERKQKIGNANRGRSRPDMIDNKWNLGNHKLRGPMNLSKKSREAMRIGGKKGAAIRWNKKFPINHELEHSKEQKTLD